jgi:hypothetical protein
VVEHDHLDARRNRPALQHLRVVHLVLVGEVRLEQIEIRAADDLIPARLADVEHEGDVDPPEGPLPVLDPEQDVFEIVEWLEDRVHARAERSRRRFQRRLSQGPGLL